MPTPFDPAVRIQQRALDTIRISLLAEAAREMEIVAAGDELDAEFAHQMAVAAMDWQIATHPYGQRIRARRSELANERSAVDKRLHQLRDAAMEACGQLLAITEAASGFASERQRREAAADQAHIDDLNGSHRRGPFGMASRRASAAGAAAR